MNIIEVRNLKKYFGKTKAIDDITFNVSSGESFGFLGPNGAGKTTTIRCLMSFICPTSGEVKLFGQSPVTGSTVYRDIGYLPGSIKLYDSWTGEEHIQFVRKLKKLEKMPDSLIQKLNFNPLIKAKTLSTGNRQKLGIILALMARPKLLILDEPTNGLDPLLQTTIYQLFEDLKKEGTTIFISSHNLPEVERLCSKVGIIKEGKLVALEKIGEMESKRMHQVKITFNEVVEEGEFADDGVEILEKYNDCLKLNVKGDLNPLLKKLTQKNIKDLEISHASLEEVFLEFYRNSAREEK